MKLEELTQIDKEIAMKRKMEAMKNQSQILSQIDQKDQKKSQLKLEQEKDMENEKIELENYNNRLREEMQRLELQKPQEFAHIKTQKRRPGIF